MALSEDQKAVLRLLAQRGEQGYGDLSALLGVDAAEVHKRAQEAAKQLEAEGIPAPAIPALPGGAAAPPEQPEASPPEPPTANAPPRESAEPKLDAGVEAEPGGTKEPAQEERKAKQPIGAKPAATSRSRLRLPESRGARFAIAANVLAVLGIVLIVVLSAGDDSGDGDDGAASAGAETATSLPSANGKNVTKAVLAPVDGGSGSGVAVFGRVKNRLVLQIAAEGLEPSANGESYTVWLSQSPQKMLPLAATKVTENGRIAASAEIPVEILGFLASETFDYIAVTRTDDQRLQEALKVATSRKDAPSYTGAEVLRGTVTGPIVGAANRGEETDQP